jgi:glucose-6-phosphate dehydrogenase assembly protein OpcA
VILDLINTHSAAINAALIDARRRNGSPAVGMVLTLVIVAEEKDHYDALKAATDAAREHPSRILVVIARTNSGRRVPARLDAEVRVGAETGPGEVVVLRTYGALSRHSESVVLPLLLPDAPVVAWWPDAAPSVPSNDPVGVLAQRRVTDSALSGKPLVALRHRRDGYSPGDTDLSWTRLTAWRTLLAATLDEPYSTIEQLEVIAEKSSPSAELLALWLERRLQLPVQRTVSHGPGITAIRMGTSDGDLAISRPDGRLAVLARPGQPDRPVALHRRDTSELIAEELRRLDPDDVYAETIAAVSDAES